MNFELNYVIQKNTGKIAYHKRKIEPHIFYKHLKRYILYWHCGMSQQAIGELTRCKHATVIHSLKEAVNLLETNAEFCRTFEKILKDCNLSTRPLPMKMRTYGLKDSPIRFNYEDRQVSRPAELVTRKIIKFR